MATDVIMPALGMAQETGKLLRWLKSEGEPVAKGEPLMEVETDKVTVEVEAPAEGTLGGVRAGEGEDVPVGEVVALILAAGETAPEPAASPNPASDKLSLDPAPALETVTAPTPAQEPNGRRSRRPLASPKARRLAQVRGVDITSVAGSGPNGAVVAADVEAAVGSSDNLSLAPEAPGFDGAAAEPLEVGSVWRAMARHTTASWQQVPHFYLRREVDATRLTAWRAVVRARPGCEALTPTDLLVKVSAEALRRHPRVNAQWRDGELVEGSGVNVAIAVATDDGLIAPVIHGADTLTLPALVARRREIVAAAREARLRPEDVAGGTFTISNLGMFGVDSFDAIVNAPQAAILAVGRIRDQIVPVEGQPAVRPMLALSLSFDHRVVDGARGAEFLDTLAGFLEEPAGLVR